MLIKECDYLSPKITLYYKGLSSHSSIFSGILSLISIIIIISFGIYFSLDFIQKKNPDAYYINQFVEDAGEFPLNSSALFHFISLGETDYLNLYKGFDFRSFRLIGFDTFQGGYLDKDLEKYDHWLYGLCNNDSDTKGIGYLITDDNFKKSACIRKYYDSLEKKYYDTNEKEFKWPTLSHGNFNSNSRNYQLIVDKCDEDTLKLILGDNYHCKSENEIKEYFSGNWGIYFYFVDQYIDVSNYKEPNKKFLFRIENALSRENFSINHLNFNPSLITTHDGMIFENIKKKSSYIYDRNDVFVYPEDLNNNIYMGYYLWLKNRMSNYERTYKRIQHIISDIGGISEFVTFVATFFNFFYKKYIILIDSEKIFFSFIEEKEKITEKNNENTFRINIYNKLENLKDNQQNFESTKSLASIRLKFDKKKLNNLQTNLKMKNNSSIQQNLITNNSRELINFQKMITNKKYEYEYVKKINNNEKNILDSKIKKNNFSFINYLFCKILCGEEKNNLKMYKNFIIKIISEEYYIKNHFNIYRLLKINENYLNDFNNKHHLKVSETVI